MLRTAQMLSALVTACACVSLWAQASASGADFAGRPASADARYAVHWIVAAADNQGLPFAVVDKKAARLLVFASNGHLLGDSPVLLGLTPGDQAPQRQGKVEVDRLAASERVTPAGRFESEPGHNHRGEPIVWFDYDAALAIHRLRPAAARERRAQRLASAVPADNRISLGCVVVPVAFYERVVAPMLGRQRGVVYVLPEDQPIRQMFGRWDIGLAGP